MTVEEALVWPSAATGLGLVAEIVKSGVGTGVNVKVTVTMRCRVPAVAVTITW